MAVIAALTFASVPFVASPPIHWAMIRAPGEGREVGRVLRDAPLVEGIAAVDDEPDGEDDDGRAEREQGEDLAALGARRRLGFIVAPQLMVMAAEPESVRVPNRAEMMGVIGVNWPVTRTEITLPGAWLEQVLPVHAPEGGVPAGGASTHDMYVFETVPKGDIIRLAAAGDVREQRRVVGRADGPPLVPQAGSLEPR